MMKSKMLIPILAVICGLVAAGPAAAQFAVSKNLAYADRSERNVLDLYLPDGVENPPVVMWIHGGGWSEGSKNGPVGLMSFINAGIGVAAMNYRFCPQAVWPAQLEDMQDAFAFLRSHAQEYGFDGTKLAVFGHSAGGQLSAVAGLALAADPATRLVASVVYAGPADFINDAADTEAFWKQSGRTAKAVLGATRAESCLIGGPIADNPELAFRASPLSYLADLPPEAKLPDMLFLQGARDYVVSPFQTRRLFDALIERAPDAEIEYMLVKRGSHEGFATENPARMELVAAFLRRSFDR